MSARKQIMIVYQAWDTAEGQEEAKWHIVAAQVVNKADLHTSSAKEVARQTLAHNAKLFANGGRAIILDVIEVIEVKHNPTAAEGEVAVQLTEEQEFNG